MLLRIANIIGNFEIRKSNYKKTEFYQMFTGIIETMGLVSNITSKGTNLQFTVESSLAPQLKIDQSLSHDGACLTIESSKNSSHIVTAVRETLSKTTLGSWKTGKLINLEQCLKLDSRLDGHLVQGHIDTTAICINRREENGSWMYKFKFSENFASLIIEKGSICLNGISLTVFDVTKNEFSIAVIPYTYENTNLKMLFEGEPVNIEFDLIGKYITRHLKL